jgi:hypothetical protein
MTPRRVCAAVRAECPAKLKDGSIDAEWTYAEYYDADGMLVGVHSLQSTGCKPLDEHLLLSHRHFRTMFSEDGKPDLDGVKVELAPGTPKSAVRLVTGQDTGVLRLLKQPLVNLPDMCRTESGD